MIRSLVILSVCLMLASCTPNLKYEKVISIPDQQWSYNNKAVYEVDIKDTAALYELSLVVRHLTSFEYTNLWIRINTFDPSGNKEELKFEVRLGDNQEQQWIGECMNDICDRAISVNEELKFPAKGTYTFEVEHIMRTNPLQGILGVGLKLHKY